MSVYNYKETSLVRHEAHKALFLWRWGQKRMPEMFAHTENFGNANPMTYFFHFDLILLLMIRMSLKVASIM